VLDADALLRRLTAAGVRYIVVGGFAVIAHGVIRATKDLDMCPDPDRGNLGRLARLLTDLHATQADTGDFDPHELAYDPARADDLAQGGNFRLVTDLGELDILQWISGIEADLAYTVLDAAALELDWHGVRIKVASLEHVRTMKRAAGRPHDLQDLADLEIANG
jgi:hypothetical protein